MSQAKVEAAVLLLVCCCSIFKVQVDIFAQQTVQIVLTASREAYQ
jgi:hypothetical protein